jgi:Outer membrane protein beta-barrel domain
MTRFLVLFATACILFVTATANAQTPSAQPNRGYAFGMVGSGGFAEESQPSGTILGGGAGINFGPKVFAEFTADQLHYDVGDQWFNLNGEAMMALGRVGYRFGSSRAPVRLVVAGSAGFIHDVFHRDYGDLPFEGSSTTIDAPLWGGSVGAEIKAGSKAFIRPEFGVVGSPQYVPYARATVIAGFRF